MRGAASGPRISVSHVFDAGALARLDFDDLADDLTGGIPPKFLHPDVLSRLEHLALARDCATGRYLGLAGATAGFLDGQTFVQLELGLIAAGTPDDRWQERLILRLLAGIVLRAAGLYDAPGLLMARTGDRGWLRGLQNFAASFPGAVFYPAVEGKIIPLQTVCAARGLAAAVLPGARLDAASGELRGAQGLTECLLGCGRHSNRGPQRLAVVDLRGLEEAVLVQKARQLYRRRCDSPFPRPVRAAAATRSPAAVLYW
jgi:hypothetical protein